MKTTLITLFLLASISSVKETKTDQQSIDQVIEDSLQLDNTVPSNKTIMENDVTSRSLSNELSEAFSKIIASTPIKSENLPPNEEELDNLKHEGSEVQNASEKSHSSNEDEHTSSDVEEHSQTSHSDTEVSNVTDTEVQDDNSVKPESSNVTENEGPEDKSHVSEASNVSGHSNNQVEEASVETKKSQLSSLEDQNEQIDNLETLPVDKDEEETSQKEQELNGTKLFFIKFYLFFGDFGLQIFCR
jgi:hypothetical protein